MKTGNTQLLDERIGLMECLVCGERWTVEESGLYYRGSWLCPKNEDHTYLVEVVDPSMFPG